MFRILHSWQLVVAYILAIPLWNWLITRKKHGRNFGVERTEMGVEAQILNVGGFMLNRVQRVHVFNVTLLTTLFFRAKVSNMLRMSNGHHHEVSQKKSSSRLS